LIDVGSIYMTAMFNIWMLWWKF